MRGATYIVIPSAKGTAAPGHVTKTNNKGAAWRLSSSGGANNSPEAVEGLERIGFSCRFVAHKVF